MKRWLESRNIYVGHDPSHQELIAMVESKLHEPTSTGFDDPTEWSEEDMKEYLRNVSAVLLWLVSIYCEAVAAYKWYQRKGT